MTKRDGSADLRSVVEALKHIKSLDKTEAQVDIINMSVGGPNAVDGLDDAINDLASKKVMVAAAG